MSDMIKIPDEFYLGRREQGKDDLPLGFLTPEGTDSAARKRKETVNSWSKSMNYRWELIDGQWKKFDTGSLGPQVIKNELLSGYEIQREIRRTSSWNGGNVVWRMVDPRGFEFEISSGNLAKILDCATISKGVITSPCILGRLGPNNILMPEGSEPYQKAVADTKVLKSDKISLKEIQLGDYVELKNNMKGIYLGAWLGLQKESKRTTQSGGVEHEGHYYGGYNHSLSTITRESINTKKRKRYFVQLMDKGSKSEIQVLSKLEVVVRKPADKILSAKEALRKVNASVSNYEFAGFSDIDCDWKFSMQKVSPEIHQKIVNHVAENNPSWLSGIYALIDGQYKTLYCETSYNRGSSARNYRAICSTTITDKLVTTTQPHEATREGLKKDISQLQFEEFYQAVIEFDDKIIPLQTFSAY